jgi:hypothetical protein
MDAAPATSLETLSANLRTILRGLMAALGGLGLDAVRAVAMHRRVSQVAGKIERMLVRFRAGRLWRVSQRSRRVAGAIRRRRIDTLPRRFGWLVQAGGYRAAGFGSQLQTVLNAPEMAALLAASPQAVRLLKPLCRALAVEMPGCAAPQTTEPKAAPIRRRKPRARPEPFRIPLPRGVLAAARRQGFGKVC